MPTHSPPEPRVVLSVAWPLSLCGTLVLIELTQTSSEHLRVSGIELLTPL